MASTLGPRASILPAVPIVHTAKPPPAFGVFLGPVGYALARVGIFLLHVACIINFIAAGWGYLRLPTTRLASMFTFYSLTLPRNTFERIGIVHFVIAGLHVYVLVATAAKRWFHRRFHRQATSIHRRLTHLLSSSPIQRPTETFTDRLGSSISSRIASVKRTRLGSLVWYLHAVLLSPRGLFGVESHHFEIVFLAREVTETILQAYQAYMMSRLLPREQLNRFYVVVLVLNCWSTPLLHRFVGTKNPALSRLLCLLCDMLLDFISVVGVPLWLTLDYMGSYDPLLTDFPDSLWYDDTWLVRFMNDAPLILLSSWLEAFSRLVFSLSLLSTIDDVKNLIKRKRATANRVEATTQKPPASSANDPLRAVVTLQRSRLVRWTHRLMVVFGVVILGVQLHAENKPIPPSCVLRVRPWLITQPACALVEINCLVQRELSGNRTNFEHVFANLDTASLEHIVFRHCPQVEITARFQTFDNLIGLKTYNATLATWDTDAAITLATHPQLRFLYLVRTDFPNATLPAGLLSSQFPETLKDIEICGTNINWLPDDLHERWPKQLTLFIEYGELTTFPMVLIQMEPRMLSLCNNKITMLPSAALVMPTTYLVAFTGNPILVLPDLDADAAVVADHMFLDTTFITDPLPLWINEAVADHTAIYLGSTPFCVDVGRNESADEYAALLETRPWLVDGRVDCEVYDEQSFYPLGIDVRENEDAA